MKTIKEMKAKLQAKKQDNKGFSLVELIIVIAIMAILVGIIASQVIPYMEKSRESKDITLLDTCLTSFQTIMADKEIAPQGTGAHSDTIDKLNSTDAATWLKFKNTPASMTDEMAKLIGLTGADGAAIKADLASKFSSEKAGNGEVKFGIDGSTVFVEVGSLRVDNKKGACK